MPGYALLADTEPDRLKTYEHFVRYHGLDPVSVRDGDAAVATLKSRGAPALLMTDLSLPKTDGFGVLAALREVSKVAPALVVSAFVELRNAALQRRVKLGIAGVLAPSMPVHSFARAIDRALRSVAVEELPAPVPSKALDAARLEALNLSGLVEREPLDEELQALCAQVAKMFRVPTAFISLVGKESQFFKAYYGLTGDLLTQRGTPIAQSFCRHVVDAGAALVVPDAQASPVFAENELVTTGALRSYAGVPLQTHTGAVLGTLCVLDTQPLRLSAEQIDQLKMMARHVAGKLALRAQRSMLEDAQGVGQALAVAGLRGPLAEAGALEVVLSALDTGVMLMTADDRKVIYANHALAKLAGLPREAILGMSRDEWIRQNCTLFDDPAPFLQKLQVLPHGPFAAQEEFEVQRPIPRIIRWTARPLLMGDLVVQLALYEDVTTTQAGQRAQELLSSSDPVTGLANRRGILEALLRDVSRAVRDSTPLSVCLFSVDALDRVSRTHGDEMSDQLLKGVAQKLLEGCRGSDMIGRWGGAEFLVILPESDLNSATRLADRLRTSLAALPPGLPSATLSGGVAGWATEEEMAHTIGRAERALAAAQAQGGDCVRMEETRAGTA